MEFKGLYWLQPRFGVGLSFGFGSWWAEEDGIQPPFALPALEDEESSVTLSTLPIGASVYFRPIVQPKFALNLEAGIRYVAIWDDVTVLLDGETPTGDDVSIQIEHDGDADGGWIAVLGADLELNIASNVFLGFGVGYQFDLTDQDYTLWDGQPRDLSFDGIGLRGTFGVRF
jgi:hypothetical protein